jgi:hypothetical protein
MAWSYRFVFVQARVWRTQSFFIALNIGAMGVPCSPGIVFCLTSFAICAADYDQSLKTGNAGSR